MPKTDHSFDLRAYATVAERIALFYREHPTGRIETDLITRDAESVTFRARVYRADGDQVSAATGWATEREGDGDINTVACLENTETSAIGRALANLGYTASPNRPSREEMLKAERARERHAGLVGRLREPTASYRSEAERCADPGHAATASDLLDLLGVAERAGLRTRRAARLRERLGHGPPIALERMEQLERYLRGWLEKQDRAIPGQNARGA